MTMILLIVTINGYVGPGTMASYCANYKINYTNTKSVKMKHMYDKHTYDHIIV